MRARRTYVQLHTHPSSPSFSALDIRVVADHHAIRTTIAVGADGTWYVVSRQLETEMLDRHALYDAFFETLIRLQDAGTPSHELSHLVMEHVVARHGLRYDRVVGASHEPTTP